MKSIHVIIAVLFSFFLNCSFAESKTLLQGSVMDESGNPLPSANIFILETSEGTTTDTNGNFKLLTVSEGIITLRATMVGYSSYKKEIDLSVNTGSTTLQIILTTETIEFAEAVVMGSSFSSEKGKGVVVSSVDVMTTPGGAADLFQSLKTMPGTTQVSESAELYVRGGDPTETVTMIDQASIYHPYTYESSYGGLFSNLNTGAVNEMYFSSGGFSAKYGNVLSGVLDIQTKDIPEQIGFSMGISLAALGFDGEIPLINDKLGFRFYSQKSFTKPVMWFNGELDDFTAAPSSNNLTSSLIWKLSDTNRLKLTTIFANDEQGVTVQRAEYNGEFNGNSETLFSNLQYTGLIGRNTIIKSSLSYSSHENNWQLGVLDLSITDRVYKSRTDIEHTFSENIQLLAGVEFELREQLYKGVIPKEDYDIRPGTNGDLLNEKIPDNRTGGYAEIKKMNLFNIENLYIIGGFRSDFFTERNLTSIDFRSGLGYDISETSKLRFAFGTFHQVPDLRLYAEVDGNPDLEAMSAKHFVLSFDQELDNRNSLRLEVYHKKYDNLPLEDVEVNYNNDGYGYASGLDLIIKGSLPMGLNGWLSYGFINTKRKWMEFNKLTESNFDITHNLALILKYNIAFDWQLGINFKYATGRPFSPVTGSVYHPEIDLFEPVYGEDNSERYPDYKRLDLRITHFTELFNYVSAVFYIEALNILDIKNLFGYSYSRDYSERQNIRSYFGRRTLVIGTVIAF